MLGVHGLLLAHVDLLVGDLSIGKGFDETCHAFQAAPLRSAINLHDALLAVPEADEGSVPRPPASCISPTSILDSDGATTSVSVHGALVLIA
jgi:hypothetical protein